MEISQKLMLLTFICFKNTIMQAQFHHGHAYALMDIHIDMRLSPSDWSEVVGMCDCWSGFEGGGTAAWHRGCRHGRREGGGG